MVLDREIPEDGLQKLIERYRALADTPARGDELEREAKRFDKKWKAALPYAPPTLYLLLGDKPSMAINFDELATERDLFGSEEEVYFDEHLPDDVLLE